MAGSTRTLNGSWRRRWATRPKGSTSNRARRASRIPFDAIRDDGVSRLGGESSSWCYESPQEYYETHDELYNHYMRSWHADQPASVAVLCEAAGMVPMLERAVRHYRVPVASSSGFDSLTVKHDLFQDALAQMDDRLAEKAVVPPVEGRLVDRALLEQWRRRPQQIHQPA